MRKLISLFLVFSLNAQAAPPAGVGSQSSPIINYSNNTIAPYKQATKLAGVNTLLETGNTNEFENPGFEHSTVTTGWTVSNATASAEIVNELSGLKSLSLALTGALSLSQLSTINAAKQLGVQKTCSVYVDSVDVSDLRLCSLVNGSEDKCTIAGGYTQGSGKRKLTVSFQGGATSSGCKLKSTDTTGTVLVDDFVMGDGAPIVDFSVTTDTLTLSTGVPITGATTNPTKATTKDIDIYKYNRIGDKLRVTFSYQHTTSAGSASGSGEYLIGLPSGLTIDTSKISTAAVGSLEGTSSATGAFVGSMVFTGGTTSVRMYLTANAVGSGYAPMAQTVVRYSGSFEVPIVGWGGQSSSAYVSTSSDTSWSPCTFSTFAWQGMGTVTDNFLSCKRTGSNLKMRGNFRVGTTAAAQARMPLPSNYGSITASYGNNYIHGNVFKNATAGVFLNVLTGGASTNYVTFSAPLISAANNTVTPVNGDVAFASSQEIYINDEISIPITGWQDSSVIVGSFEGIEKCADNGECDDTFSAKVTTTSGAHTAETKDWISSCTAANPTVCTFVASTFSTTPNCTLTTVGAPAASTFDINAVSASSITIASYTGSTGSPLASVPVTLSCQKTGADYKPKTAKIATSIDVPTIAGSGAPKIFGLSLQTAVCSSTPCTASKVLNTSVLGTTFTRNSTGNYSVTFNGITTSICTVVINPIVNQANKCQLVSSSGGSSATVLCFNSTPAAVDEGFSLSCIGN